MSAIKLLDLLHDIEEELDQHVDIQDDNEGGTMPNWAMHLQARVRRAIYEMGGVK